MKIAAHGWELALRPDLGGSVAALAHDGHDVLRRAAGDIASPLEAACFPLIPYANRIADGRFTFDGQEHAIPRNFGDHPHPLHGVGWHSPWQVARADSDSILLTHHHDGSGGWPWAYRATQRFTLSPGGIAIELGMTSHSDVPAPAGLGLHPYFPCDDATRLTAAASNVWLTDARLLPTAAVAPDRFGDWTAGAPVEGTDLIDNAYSGWNGVAVVAQGWGSLRITAAGVSNFHLYRPPGTGHFCLEPVSHLPDAINRAGMRTLCPGETMSLRMTIAV